MRIAVVSNVSNVSNVSRVERGVIAMETSLKVIGNSKYEETSEGGLAVSVVLC
jgi:hypothetical protein